ncbi:uncharacterized protein LOC127861990 isoform X2 [Dreissena polymorpha]|nr:uncharacterized protein LOC127861990 isoform X2 [Dreissena polymorpha]
MATKSRGLKRATSPVRGPQSAMRGHRKVLAELQTSGLVSESAIGKVPSKKTVQFAAERVGKDQRMTSEASCFEDQSGIEFEADSAALDSILNDTGIQVPVSVPGSVSRHTIATAMRRTSSMAPPARVPVKEFQRACEEVLNKGSQPAPKRQRLEKETSDNSNYNLKLTPSKTDFCSKFDVQKSSLFKQDTNPFGRPSLYNPSRPVADESNPFTVPSRPSLAQQVWKRKNQDSGAPAVVKTESSAQPDIPRTSSTESSQSWTPFSRRFSLAARNFAQDGAPTNGRLSISAMTPRRVPKTEGDRKGMAIATGSVSSCFGSNAVEDSLKVPIKDEKDRQLIDTRTAGTCVESWSPFSKRTSLAARQENPAPNVGIGRPSLGVSSMTPRRVPRSDSLPSVTKNYMPSVGRISLAMQTPLRVVKEERADEDNGDAEDFEDKLATKLEFGDCNGESTDERQIEAPVTPSNLWGIGNTVILKKDGNLLREPFARQIQSYTPKGTPSRVPRQPNTPQTTPPARVPRQPNTPQTTPPARVPRQPNTPQTTPPARVRLPITPSTPASRVPAQRCFQDQDDKENVAVKHPNRNARPTRDPDDRQGSGNGDIRSYWKTKKTPSKSPIMKEVLVREGMTDQTEQAAPTVDQDAMQASPKEDSSTPQADLPPLEPPLISTSCQQTFPSMQLPITSLSLALESSSTGFLHENVGLKNRNQARDGSHKIQQQFDSQSQLQTIMTKLSTSADGAHSDSSVMTQQNLDQIELGRSVSIGRDVAQSSRLLDRATIVKEAKEALASYQARHFLGITVPEVSHKGLCDVNLNVMLASNDLDLENGNIGVNHGILSADLGNKLNQNQNDNKQLHCTSEMVVDNANSAKRPRGILDICMQNVSSSASQSWMTCDLSSEKNPTNLAPSMLRKSSSQGNSGDNKTSDLHSFQGQHSPTPNKLPCKQNADKNLNSISPPLWTPLIMKSVAKQTYIAKTGNKEDISNTFVKKDHIVEKQVLDITDGQAVLGCDNELSTSDDKSGICMQTPPSAKRKSAFHRYDNRCGLTPTIGALSLRANVETRKRRPLDKKWHELNQLTELYLAYQEECVNREVERLSMLWRGPECLMDRCPDPVARILQEGDNMHFFPIEIQAGGPEDLTIEGSAFIRVADQRST